MERSAVVEYSDTELNQFKERYVAWAETLSDREKELALLLVGAAASADRDVSGFGDPVGQFIEGALIGAGSGTGLLIWNTFLKDKKQSLGPAIKKVTQQASGSSTAPSA